MGEEKAVVDTNVIVSAIGWDGIPECALDELHTRAVRIVLSEMQDQELRRVLSRTSMPRGIRRRRNDLLESIAQISERVTLSGISGLVPADPNDDMILDAALASGAKWIITGDRHLLALDGFAGIHILTPQQFLHTCMEQRS